MKSLRTKILLGYGLLLTFIVIVGGWGLFSLKRLGAASANILQDNYRSIEAADQMIAAIERQDSTVLSMLLSDPKQGIDQFRDHEVTFLQWLGLAKDNITLPEEKDSLQQIESRYKAYLATFDQLITQNAESSTKQNLQYSASIRPSFEAVSEACRQLKQQNQQAMFEESAIAQNVAQETMMSLAIAGSLAAISGLFLSWILSERILQPIKQLMTATEEVAQGNYQVDLDIKTQDELQYLAAAFLRMTQKLGAFNRLNVGQVIADKRRNEAILHSMSDGVLVVDDHLQVVEINAMAAKILMLSEFEVKHYRLSEILQHSELYESVEQAVHFDQTLDHSELVITQENQAATQYFNTIVTPVMTDQHRKLGVVILFQNITRFKELDQLKSEFVATASHELRTPLTGIMMSMDLLMEKAHQKLLAPEKELLASAQENILRLRTLVNDLLDLSKIEAGKFTLAQAPTSLATVFTEAIATFRLEAESKQIKLRQVLPDTLPKAYIDASQITRVLNNIIANALRYTHADGEITLKAQADNREIEVSVTDDGEGISPQHQARLFQKFVQVETERDVGGSGLGLAICQKIVQAHGGDIRVESDVGCGSTFTFSLPAA